MIHYIISVYAGLRANRHVNLKLGQDPLYFVKQHLEMIKSLSLPLIEKITFVISPSENRDIDQSIVDYIEKFKIQNLDIKFVIDSFIRSDNDFHSYGCWNHAMIKNIDENLNFFLIEDDYLPNCDDFYLPFLEKMSDDVAYVCQWWTTGASHESPHKKNINRTGVHAAISNGLMNISVARAHYKKYEECANLKSLYKSVYGKTDKGIIEKRSPGVVSQIHFLDNYINMGYRVLDINSDYCNPFLNPNNLVKIYGKQDGEILIKPIEN